MKKLKIILLLTFFAVGSLLQRQVAAQITLSKNVLDNGGVVLSDRSFRIVGTLGQPFIALAQDPTIVNSFLYVPSQMPTPDLEQTTSSPPKEFRLEQNYPNPFNPETTVRFQLPVASQVVVRIFNVLGQEIRRLADEHYEAGFHSLRWDGRNTRGNAVSSGIYFYRLQAGTFIDLKKMNVLK